MLFLSLHVHPLHCTSLLYRSGPAIAPHFFLRSIPSDMPWLLPARLIEVHIREDPTEEQSVHAESINIYVQISPREGEHGGCGNFCRLYIGIEECLCHRSWWGKRIQKTCVKEEHGHGRITITHAYRPTHTSTDRRLFISLEPLQGRRSHASLVSIKKVCFHRLYILCSCFLPAPPSFVLPLMPARKRGRRGG